MESLLVKVELLGMVRNLGEANVLEVDLSGAGCVSYRDVMAKTVERLGPAFPYRIYDTRPPAHEVSYLRTTVKILADGEWIKDLDQRLPPQGERTIQVMIFGVAGGG